MRDWNNEKKKLIKLIQVENIPYEQIGKMYNCSGSNIKKVAKKLGIELTPKRKINKNETYKHNESR